jgi:hypothetical protein
MNNEALVTMYFHIADAFNRSGPASMVTQTRYHIDNAMRHQDALGTDAFDRDAVVTAIGRLTECIAAAHERVDASRTDIVFDDTCTCFVIAFDNTSWFVTTSDHRGAVVFELSLASMFRTEADARRALQTRALSFKASAISKARIVRVSVSC